MLRLLLWTAGFTVLGCGLVLLAAGSKRLDRIHQLPQFELASGIERYQLEGKSAPIVLLGSSAARELPPDGRERADVFTMSLLGYSSLLGLEVLVRTGAAPRLVLVEGTFGYRREPMDILAEETDPLPRRLHADLPLARAQFHWINSLWNASLPVQPELVTPAQSWPDWRAYRHPWLAGGASAFTTPYALKDLHDADREIARYRELVAALERRGTRVVFYDLPLDPEIQALPGYIEWAAKMHEAFADHDWVTDSPEGYYLYDGVHFVSGSGERFFELLLRRAGANSPDAHALSGTDQRQFAPTDAGFRKR